MDFGVGIGIHCGELSFGEFGRSHRDLTAIGTVVNTAARLQGAAAPGEILATEAVRERVGDLMREASGNSLRSRASTPRSCSIAPSLRRARSVAGGCMPVRVSGSLTPA